jgi:hypothetical protein
MIHEYTQVAWAGRVSGTKRPECLANSWPQHSGRDPGQDAAFADRGSGRRR